MEEERRLDDGDGACDCSDSDETLSLTDLPVDRRCWASSADDESKGSGEEEFEFSPWGSTEMCAAEDVFSQGQILPLRSSSASSSAAGNSGSESMDRSSSSGSEARLANAFYARPSPKPQVLAPSARRWARRRAGAAGWGMLRFGLVKPPEVMEVEELRQRRSARKTESEETNKSSGLQQRLLLFSCSCSATVETVSSRSVVSKRESTK